MAATTSNPITKSPAEPCATSSLRRLRQRGSYRSLG
jgi:hypothetical protein